mmetsp:Transcript_20454/g.49170  ORF Transcript_20454/g.49170 Transcript_20454/m.49170 type:complete len:274 (-) Transcript_20454:405-1226(-)|eukprot:CAMPEP_0181137268 /NCGR_PEP_ID=MMETSP1071-20121207/33620_1 /TAXON_ID=35127 /ORGANISM="Thalassiosira sp., Strain NH16" /LENGTH=273 /DNA_ID=CAMNT_0023224021 /DNA_START=92 /DNA_END=913 /DNA_ORIENTATION=-
MLAVSGSDDDDVRHGDTDLEAGDAQAQPQSPSSHAATSRSIVRASRPSVKDSLNVPDDELADLSLDVYNMFFLSNMGSQAFFYSLAVLITKMSLYILLIVDIKYNQNFPWDLDTKVAPVVKSAQLFLMPVAIVTQEELITSFFIFSRLKYSPEARRIHPGAYKWKYFIAHGARFMDGAMFLFINISVMLLQSDDVLGLFLNFAALMFLQTIDNIALQVCLDGYWTKSLQEAAKDVVEMKFAYRHQYVHSCLQTSFVVVIWAALLGIWAHVHYK